MGTTTFVWDRVFDCVTDELDENNTVKAVYHNEPQQYGGVLSQRRGNTSHYHHHDALVSARFLTEVGKAIQAWTNNGVGAIRSESSLEITDYAQIPASWHTLKAEKTEQYDRQVSFRPNCCFSSDRCPNAPAELTIGRDGTLITV